MIQRLRSLLLIVASASLLANGAHAITGASAASSNPTAASGPIDPTSVDYQHDGDLISGVTFRTTAPGQQFQIRLSATDAWQSCSSSGSDVSCPVSPRPVTSVHRLEYQTV